MSLSPSLKDRVRIEGMIGIGGPHLQWSKGDVYELTSDWYLIMGTICRRRWWIACVHYSSAFSTRMVMAWYSKMGWLITVLTSPIWSSVRTVPRFVHSAPTANPVKGGSEVIFHDGSVWRWSFLHNRWDKIYLKLLKLTRSTTWPHCQRRSLQSVPHIRRLYRRHASRSETASGSFIIQKDTRVSCIGA